MTRRPESTLAFTDLPGAGRGHRPWLEEVDARGVDMPVDDRTRSNLHRRLAAVLGSEEADTLTAHLPPVTWHEVATKDDLQSNPVLSQPAIAVTMNHRTVGRSGLRAVGESF